MAQAPHQIIVLLCGQAEVQPVCRSDGTLLQDLVQEVLPQTSTLLHAKKEIHSNQASYYRTIDSTPLPSWLLASSMLLQLTSRLKDRVLPSKATTLKVLTVGRRFLMLNRRSIGSTFQPASWFAKR